MSNIQIYDLDDNARLEITCKKCGSSYFLKPAEVIKQARAETPFEKPSLYLDEVEAKQKCKQRGCNGQVRLMLLEGRKASPFIGGLA